jgi:acetyltransferase-like isoleucine patch superfamily enzyme
MIESELLIAPREGASDDTVKLVRFLVAAGARVGVGTPVVEIETSKALIVVEAHRTGFMHPLAGEGQRVDVGAPLCAISDSQTPPAKKADGATGELTISNKARAAMQSHGLSAADFPGQNVVREADVARVVAARSGPQAIALPKFLGETLDRNADWDALLSQAWLIELSGRLTELRKRLKARFARHVPLGTLLHDRWAVAREYGFGEGTSVYDECLILGDVQLGKACWVGPFTVLDGAHAPLRIGDHSSIGSGTHVYTHNTIEHALSAGQAPAYSRATTIGRACFISPQCIIGPGTVLGDHSFVAAGSFVQGEYASHSFLAGNPARRVGHVELRGDRAQLVRDE